MSDLSFWRLSHSFSIFHAAILIAGREPGDYEQYSVQEAAREIPGFTAIKTALVRAVEDEKIETIKVEWDREDFGPQDVNVYLTVIPRWALAGFLREADLSSDLFEEPIGGGFADAAPRFASNKLNAAVRAARALAADPALLRGRTPKQAAIKWLTAKAAELGLLNRDGQPNSTAIEEIAKVVNWKPEGGAPATPSPEPETVGGCVRAKAATGAGRRERFSAELDDVAPPFGPRETFSAGLDDEIPF